MQRNYFQFAILVVTILCIGSSTLADDTIQAVYKGPGGKWVIYKPPIRVGPKYIETYVHPTRDRAITINVEYLDVTNNTNIGFDHPALGATRRATFEAVARYLIEIIGHAGTMDIEVEESVNTIPPDWLAEGGPFFLNAPPVGCQSGYAFIHILPPGADPDPAAPDGQLKFNFAHSWNSDMGPTAVGEYDLFSTLLHELTHVVGFISTIDKDGNGLNGTNPDVRSVGYDEFLEKPDGTRLIACPGGGFLGVAADLVAPKKVHLGGANSVATWVALGHAGKPPLYTPAPFDDGSSISHWDDVAAIPADAVMRYCTPANVMRRTYTTLDQAGLEDVGYTILIPPDLPTDPPHTDPPWVWHHDLNPPAGMTPLTPAPGPGNIELDVFVDALGGCPWHMEFQLEGTIPAPGANPAGVLVIKVPGGGWIRPYPALSLGDKFTVSFPGPPGTDFDEIRWAEIPEVGLWAITYANFTASAMLVDGGIAELDTLISDPHAYESPTEFDFTGPTPPCSLLIELTSRASVPTLSQWGIIVLALLLLAGGAIAIIRRRRAIATKSAN